MAELCQRSTTFDLLAPEGTRQVILNSIRAYRAACRQAFAALSLAAVAGAEIEMTDDALSVKPGNDAAAAILAASVGKADVTKVAGARGAGTTYTLAGGKTLGYDLRSWVLEQLIPGHMSFVWDSLRRDIATAWKAKDPEFTRASRGWLVLQGARNLSQFNYRGIGFPVLTARPKLEGHTLTLKWNHDIGQVDFKFLKKLDGGRYYVWKCLRDGEDGWKLGTVYLNERDGRLFATLTHERPARTAEVEPGRVCHLKFGDSIENFLIISGPDGAASFDTISAADAVGSLTDHKARRAALELRKAACGNPKRPWGHRKGWLANQDVLSRATRQRENLQKHTNHAWTRRVVTRAVSWRCGIVQVYAFPEGLFTHDWRWSQFESFLRYKCGERGITLILAESGEDGRPTSVDDDAPSEDGGLSASEDGARQQAVDGK